MDFIKVENLEQEIEIVRVSDIKRIYDQKDGNGNFITFIEFKDSREDMCIQENASDVFNQIKVNNKNYSRS